MSNKSQHQTPTEKQESDTSKLYLTDNSTLQTPEEAFADKNRKPSKEEEVIETNTIEEVDIDALAEGNRGGTNERKS